jgi:hypothetical protein
MKTTRWAILAFLFAAALLWRPFDDYTSVYETRPGGAIPAGEIRAGFRLVQVVHPPAGVASGDGQPCFAIKFATYAHHNRGTLRVDWRQGQRSQSWPVAADRLADNRYRNFCPDAGFEPAQPFRVEVHGIDGEPRRSATLWLVGDKRFGNAETPAGQSPEGKALALQGSVKQRVEPAGILRIDHGAWVFGWLCMLAIGIVVLCAGLASPGDGTAD